MRPLTFLTPIAWSLVAGQTLEPLALALGTPRPDLVASALQTVIFFGLCTAVLWVEGIRARGESEPVEDVRHAVRGMWSKAEPTTPTQYDLTISQDSPYYRLQNSTLLISKRLTGDAPWLALPVDITRYQIEGFYDVVILHGKAPTESNLAGWSKPFSQLELRTFRDWLYRHNWIYYLRKGNNAPWRLTPRGRRVVEYVYRMLQGEPGKAGRWLDSPTAHASTGRRAEIR